MQKDYQMTIMLKKILASKIEIQNQLSILISYRKEYLKCLEKNLDFAISGIKLIYFYNFISFLIDGIKKQKKILQECIHQYNEKIFLWRKVQIKIQMWKKILAKLSLEKTEHIQLAESNQVNALYVQKHLLKNITKGKY